MSKVKEIICPKCKSNMREYIHLYECRNKDCKHIIKKGAILNAVTFNANV